MLQTQNKLEKRGVHLWSIQPETTQRNSSCILHLCQNSAIQIITHGQKTLTESVTQQQWHSFPAYSEQFHLRRNTQEIQSSQPVDLSLRSYQQGGTDILQENKREGRVVGSKGDHHRTLVKI